MMSVSPQEIYEVHKIYEVHVVHVINDVYEVPDVNSNSKGSLCLVVDSAESKLYIVE
jgi:hypothetical protein